MLTKSDLDRLQKRLEQWTRPGNPISVNHGLELVALARKGLEAEQLEKEAAMLAGFCKCGDDYPCPPQAWGYSRFCEKEDWDSDCGHCWRAAVQIRLEKK